MPRTETYTAYKTVMYRKKDGTCFAWIYPPDRCQEMMKIVANQWLRGWPLTMHEANEICETIERESR